MQPCLILNCIPSFAKSRVSERNQAHCTRSLQEWGANSVPSLSSKFAGRTTSTAPSSTFTCHRPLSSWNSVSVQRLPLCCAAGRARSHQPGDLTPRPAREHRSAFSARRCAPVDRLPALEFASVGVGGRPTMLRSSMSGCLLSRGFAEDKFDHSICGQMLTTQRTCRKDLN